GLSVLLFVGGVLCTPLREELSRRVGSLLERALGAPPPQPPVPAPAGACPPSQQGPSAAGVPARPLPSPPCAAPLLLAGTWVPSGWMGDAEDPEGPLRHRFPRDGGTGPTCSEWSYSGQGALGWVAVAYQFPESNWGGNKGRDLRRHGFTRVTLLARGQ